MMTMPPQHPTERHLFMSAPYYSSTPSRASGAPSRSSGAPARSAGTPSRGGAPRRPNRGASKSTQSRAPKVTAASELERLLDLAMAQPVPADRTFAELGLPKSLVIALSKRGIEAPFAIQSRTIPDADAEGTPRIGARSYS